MRFKFEKVVSSKNELSYKLVSIEGVKQYEELPDKYRHGKECCHKRSNFLILMNRNVGVYEQTIACGQIIPLKEWDEEVMPFLKKCKKSLKAVYKEHENLCSQWHGEVEIKI